MKNVFFHFPDFDAFVSGGNSYNKKFEQVLLENHSIQKADRISDADVVVSDTIFLKNSDELDFLNTSNYKKVIIVHHLKYFEDNKYFEEFHLLKEFDLLIANSEFTSSALQKNGIEPNKIIIIEPPIYVLETPPSKKKHNSIKALMAANWINRKGFVEMFNEIKAISSYCSNLTITIYGDSTLDKAYYENCVQIIKESPILSKIIEVKEVLAPMQLANTYQNYNLYISASKMETYGMAVKEALYNGLYVLALNKGNLPYLVKKPIQGELFENISGLVRYLFYLAENNIAFTKIVENSGSLESYSKNKFESQIQNFINQLL